jgi:hypothetical protein
MDLYEDLILQYLTKDAHVFVNPQYSIQGDPGTEWSCPDFVALDFRKKLVLIVEVSSAANPKSLRERVKNREGQWIEKLRSQLRRNGVVDDTWNYRVELFIRDHAAKQFRKDLEEDTPGIAIHLLEELGPPWVWRRSYVPEDGHSSSK